MKRVTLRRIGLLGAALLLTLFAVSTLLRFIGSRELRRAVAEFEDAVGPVEFEAYRPAPVADADNLALPVIEAMEWVGERSGEPGWLQEADLLERQNRRAASGWSSEDWSRARTLVDSSDGMVEILETAIGRSGSSFELDYAAGPMMEIPFLLEALQVGNLLHARARVAWEDGNPEEAVRAVEALDALGRALEGEPLLVFQLVGCMVETLQYRAIQEGLAPRAAAVTHGLGPAALRRLRASAAKRPRADRFVAVLGTEGATTYLTRPGGPAERDFMFSGSWLDRAASVLVDFPRWLDRYRYHWLGYQSVARGLGYFGRIARGFPHLSYAEMLEQPDFLETPPHDRRTFVPDLEVVVGRLKATEALARLGRASLDVAITAAESGSLSAELPTGLDEGDGALTGNRFDSERLDDGSVVLRIPGAEKLWRRVGTAVTDDRSGAPLFTWHLAPPA